ncbi:MAG: arginine--tRNA ligase, partial [Chloroflexota bacterium]
MPRLEFQIAKLVSHAIKKAQDSGDLPDFDIPDIVVEHPKDTSRGDLASPSCLGLARLARKAPLEIAEIVARHLSPSPIVSEVEAVRPGFINIKLDTSWLQQQVDEILLRGGQYADIDLGGGASIQVEYGSANPTGPLHVGFGRNVVLGDGLANALSAAGYQVHREYYVNDAGTQIDKFADSLYARYAQSLGEEVELPPDG